MSVEVKRWIDPDGMTWLCGAPDHGPMCRQCWCVDDEVKEAILGNIDHDRMAVVGWSNGEPRLRVTAAGNRAIQELLAQGPGGSQCHDDASPSGVQE